MAGHKHAALMAEYAKDAAETDRPWERWQFANSRDEWVDLNNVGPSWDAEMEYRRKPRTLTIGGAEVEAPIESIRNDEVCYTSDQCGQTTSIKFSDQSKQHCTALVKGRLFATPEAAKAAYDAITALLTGEDAA